MSTKLNDKEIQEQLKKESIEKAKKELIKRNKSNKEILK